MKISSGKLAFLNRVLFNIMKFKSMIMKEYCDLSFMMKMPNDILKWCMQRRIQTGIRKILKIGILILTFRKLQDVRKTTLLM